MSFSSTLETGKSHMSESIEPLLCRALVCMSAVRKPLGYVKPASQQTRDEELGFGVAGLELEDKKRERRKSTRLEQSR